jgi:hypothetical protein
MVSDERGDLRHDRVAMQQNGTRDYRAEQAKFEAEIDALPDFKLRAPCRCGSTRGKGPRDVSGQAMIYCAECRRHAYNAPKHETGRGVRKVLNREAIDSFTRARILEAAGSACSDCGKRAPEVILHIAHMISVADCKDLGGDSDDYNDEYNLFVACEECNLAYGGRSIAPLHMARLILRHNRYRRGRPQP